MTNTTFKDGDGYFSRCIKVRDMWAAVGVVIAVVVMYGGYHVNLIIDAINQSAVDKHNNNQITIGSGGIDQLVREQLERQQSKGTP